MGLFYSFPKFTIVYESTKYFFWNKVISDRGPNKSRYCTVLSILKTVSKWPFLAKLNLCCENFSHLRLPCEIKQVIHAKEFGKSFSVILWNGLLLATYFLLPVWETYKMLLMMSTLINIRSEIFCGFRGFVTLVCIFKKDILFHFPSSSSQ